MGLKSVMAAIDRFIMRIAELPDLPPSGAFGPDPVRRPPEHVEAEEEKR